MATEEVDDVAPTRRRRRFGLHAPHLGLRARITFAFTLSAALLSTLLAGTTWLLTRQSLTTQREASATRQAYLNAQFMRIQLGASNDTKDLLNQLSSLAAASHPILRVTSPSGHATWIPVVPQFGQNELPPALRKLVDQNKAARMRTEVDGELELVVGIPLASKRAAYYEFVSFTETQNALKSLSTTLFGAAVLTTIAGAALGWWTSRRTLRPLADVSLAAEAIAGGRLDTRLGALDDPDLGVLVTSFNHMASALEERIDRDGRFASDVSHELRSPVMTLSASIEVLASRRAEMPDASAQAAIDLMVADVGRFRQLVEDLLEISRFDAGAARLDLSEIRLGELINQAVSWSAPGTVPVELDSELAGIVIRADKRRLVRVIANLIDNAAKYAGGATRVSMQKVDEGIRIAVEDGGPGVPPEEREVVFDRFSPRIRHTRSERERRGRARVVTRRRARGPAQRPGVGRRPPRWGTGSPVRCRAAGELDMTRSHPRSALVAFMIATAVLGTGCGLAAEKHPHEISDRAIVGLLNPASSTTTTPPPANGDLRASLYFFRGQSLERVLVPAGNSPVTVDQALTQLLAGPPRSAGSDLTTSIPPGTMLRGTSMTGSTLRIDLSGDIKSLGGSAAKAAYAQLVFTALDLPGVKSVQFAIEGDNIDATTDDGSLTIIKANNYKPPLNPN